MAEDNASRLTTGAREAPKSTSFALLEAFQNTSFSELVQRLPHIPCARSSLLFGMASGASVGVIQVFAGRGISRATNWAVGSFLFVSVVGWETCRRQRAAEQARLKHIMSEHARRREERGQAPDPSPPLSARHV
ncbi:uncharacterized protein MJAP1_004174 [Malassezia japonica]|uniref:Cytochrome c oxidase assembly protein COX20, mitochondrial n=1 Tax=Malassezia japonica TaxID=223818 RepID=A0AAF0F739_9BASI|nr:uncharacterized protein MJAP1_004174 [Malassezia japonica]WFD41179.1 hypothetical protein MJAP1_004174 [Malassezia japonica]